MWRIINQKLTQAGILLLIMSPHLESQGISNSRTDTEYREISISSEINQVQPMTGIVLWNTNDFVYTDTIQLEFAYLLYNDIVSRENFYNWQVVEDILNDISSRSHQAILRFRFIHPGEETAVPDYIKRQPGYRETRAKSEGLNTWFCDWSSESLRNNLLLR